MRENFDFVSMDTYTADTRELAQRASGIIAAFRKRAEDAERLAMELVISAGGKVSVPDDVLMDRRRRIEWTQERNERDRAYEFSARFIPN